MSDLIADLSLVAAWSGTLNRWPAIAHDQRGTR
jgi:hypothetical protein